VPLENTTKRITLNEELAGQIRKQIGLDCEAPKIGSLQIEHRQYYRYNFHTIFLTKRVIAYAKCLFHQLKNGNKFFCFYASSFASLRI
jgi:hypothetical protein